ncbi:hypothetical protein DL96DRAFT_1420587, partial [Flagelloscypha sp. PMI_526]
FSVFNMLQRQTLLLHCSRRTKRKQFRQVAEDYSLVKPSTLLRLSERLATSDTSIYNDEEKRAMRLMNDVGLVNAYVLGSNSARLEMRNEICGLIMDKGLPSFFITINPNDTYNPIVRLLAGENIDINNLLSKNVSRYGEQSMMIAQNPTLGACFFHIYMTVFIQ